MPENSPAASDSWYFRGRSPWFGHFHPSQYLSIHSYIRTLKCIKKVGVYSVVDMCFLEKITPHVPCFLDLCVSTAHVLFIAFRLIIGVAYLLSNLYLLLLARTSGFDVVQNRFLSSSKLSWTFGFRSHSHRETQYVVGISFHPDVAGNLSFDWKTRSLHSPKFCTCFIHGILGTDWLIRIPWTSATLHRFCRLHCPWMSLTWRFAASLVLTYVYVLKSSNHSIAANLMATDFA